jgi:glycosyltransferase involved in cell wall biosynthesis
MVKVSVIIPVYNVVKYLPSCLDSIVSQTLQDIEIICINDGSTDNCSEVLKQYAQKDRRITVITQPNQGISSARNNGVAHAKGEYISFVDSDDEIAPDFLEKLYTAAQKHDAEIVATNIRRFLFGRYKLKYGKEAVYTDAQARINVAQIPHYNYVWNKLYRKSALRYSFTKGVYFEDINWSIRIIYEANKLVTVPDTAYYYRKIPQSIVGSNSERKTEDYRKAWQELLTFAKERGIRFEEKYYMKQKTTTSLFGITLLKGYHWSYRSRYKLFGFIPFLSVARNS